MHVLGQEVLGELAGKRHQVVERDRAGDDEFHVQLSLAGWELGVRTGCRRYLTYLPMIGARSRLTARGSRRRA